MKPRRAALEIFKAAVRASDPMEAVLRHVRVEGAALRAGRERYRLDRMGDIHVIGAGKASARMAVAVERLLGKRIASGFINVKDGHRAPLRRVRVQECGHPVPDERGVRGAREIAGIAASAQPGDLVICLISGGASALMPFPSQPVTLADKQETTRLLLASGADIHEMNAVRKHISAVKGGRLAALAAPAQVLSLILSDVIGDDLSVIGSGPTAPDRSTFQDAWRILDQRDLTGRIPPAVREHLEAGLRGEIPETPKTLSNARNVIVGGNRLALDAAAIRAKQLGFRTIVLSSSIAGETQDVAGVHAAIAREIRQSGQPLRPPACVISGGETTVTLKGDGKGGRNQEFALAAAIDIAGLDGVTILCAGTDGTDGPTDAAGAIADGTTLARAAAQKLSAGEFLANNDSYNFFDPLADLIKTGPTGTNVMDVRLVLVV